MKSNRVRNVSYVGANKGTMDKGATKVSYFDRKLERRNMRKIGQSNDAFYFDNICQSNQFP